MGDDVLTIIGVVRRMSDGATATVQHTVTIRGERWVFESDLLPFPRIANADDYSARLLLAAMPPRLIEDAV